MRLTHIPMILALLLAGCGGNDADSGTGKVSTSYADVMIVNDPDTGCQYLKLWGSNNTLTPRLDDQGRPMCPGVLP